MPRVVHVPIVEIDLLQPVFDKIYPDGASLFEDAFVGGPALPLVQLALDLRRSDRSRKQLPYIKANWDNWQKKSGIKQRVLATHHMYSAMLVLARPEEANKMKHAAEGQVCDMTKMQKQALQGSGMVLMKPKPLTERVAAARQHTEAVLNKDYSVLWVDNFHRHRYSRRPEGARERSFSGTAAAVPPAPGNLVPPPEPADWPTPQTLMERVVAASISARRAVAQLKVQTDVLTTGMGLPLSVLRVPLDIRRPHVDVPAWEPYGIWQENISSAPGLQQIVRRLLVIASQRSVCTPVLLDVDIYWRVLKLVYVQTSGSQFPIRRAMRQIIPFFGIWHAYKHCVTCAYRVFLPFIVPLEYMDFLRQPEKEHVYTTPDLVAMERLFLSLYLCSRELATTFAPVDPPAYTGAAPAPTTYHQQWTGLRTLVQTVSPILLALGVRVRDCSWGKRNGSGARETIEMCLMLCEQLTPQKQDGNYKNAMRLALLLWQPFHEQFFGGAFVEEKPEASLGRLARKAYRDPSISTVPKYNDAYITLRTPKATSSRTEGNLTKVDVSAVKGRLLQTINYLTRGQLPWIVKPAGEAGKGTVIHGVRNGWPRTASFPKIEMANLTAEELTIRMYESLSVVFFHGTYVPRPRTAPGEMTEHHRRAMANHLCSKGIAQWAYGPDMAGNQSDDPTFYARFKYGLDNAQRMRDAAARRKAEQLREAEQRRRDFAAIRCVKRTVSALSNTGGT